MASIIKLRRSATSGAAPSFDATSVNGLAEGEIAVNLFDRKIYVGNTVNGVSKIGGEDFKLTTMNQTGGGAYIRIIGDDKLSANNILLRGGGGITVSRDANGSIAFSAGIDTSQINDSAITTAKIADDAVTLGTKTTGNYIATIADAGTGDIVVSGSGSETAAVTLDLADSISSNTSGTAAKATILETTRTFTITGDVTATAQNFNGSQNVSLTTTLAADSVDGTNIADDSIDSEHYVDGSIDTAHIGDLQVTSAKIAADAIDGTKIADDAIDSEHYAAGSIDAEHIASGAVTNAKIAADAVTLGTQTTGNYIATISGTAGEIEVTGSGTETAAVTLGLPNNVTIGNDLTVSNDLTVTGDAHIDGNLTVEGSTTYLSTSTVYTDDGMFKLSANNAGDFLDTGIYGAVYHTANTSYTYSGYFRDASDNGIFKFYNSLDVEPGGTVNTSDSGYTLAQVDCVIDGGSY